MRVPFDELADTDLVPGDLYQQGHGGAIAGDPISVLMNVGNQGGFRPRGGWKVPGATLVALSSTGAEDDWPDELDVATGRYVYFGDNRSPGRGVSESLETAKGNRLLRTTFDALHRGERTVIPPFFVFQSLEEGRRDTEFVGVAAPGAAGLTERDDLVAFWKSSSGSAERFLNYRATFTILAIDRVERAWLRHIFDEGEWHDGCPGAWSRFVDLGEYQTTLRT